ncbi:outer membrane beta-barrel protein [Bradyrhizobium oligotrophicum]|uniref:outer membrane beta-barrel protein n=1 Tax=Bradyrhizobium oligotrophicum TaxID=44255 RepID=UPI003EBE468E
MRQHRLRSIQTPLLRRALARAWRLLLLGLTLLVVLMPSHGAGARSSADILLLRATADSDPGLTRRFMRLDAREELARAVHFVAANARRRAVADGAFERTGCLALTRVLGRDGFRIWRILTRCRIRIDRPVGEARVAPGTPPLSSKGDEPSQTVAEEDPYEPKGLKVGQFIVKPALEFTTGVDSNPLRLPRGRRSAQTLSAAHELEVRSQFEQHELNADLRLEYNQTQGAPILNGPTVDAKIAGRYDVTDDRAINGELRYALDPVDRVLGMPAGTLVSKPGLTLGASQKIAGVGLSVKALVDRSAFSGARPGDDAPIPNRDRNFTQPAVQARASYGLTPQISPFVDVTLDRRIHELAVDFGGFRRDSAGTLVSAGASFAFPGRLTGELALGYLDRRFADPMLPGLHGMVVNGALVYRPFDKTALILVGSSDTVESVTPGVSGIFRRDLILLAKQEFDPRTSASLSLSFGQDRFAGIARTDDRYAVALGVVYKLAREIQLKADIRQDWLRSTLPNVGSAATKVTLGVRFQY